MADDSNSREQGMLSDRHRIYGLRNQIERIAFAVVSRAIGLLIHNGRIKLYVPNIGRAFTGRADDPAIEVTPPIITT